MQSKLAMWSTEDKGRKFDRLLRLIADRTWLAEAARITLASSGARTPGVDGVDKVMMEGNLHQELATIRAELIAGSLSSAKTQSQEFGLSPDTKAMA
jgi:RNA-directed DNA polymerase